jgi:glycosyltransferase involved in cell wall biosynthesis
MRFLVISSVFPPAFQYGGIPHTSFGLTRALIASGHECQVLTTNAGGEVNLSVPVDYQTTYQGVPVIYTGRWKTNAFFYAPNLIWHMKNLAPSYDVALVSGSWGYIDLAARITFPKLGLPYLVYPHGLFDPWAFRHKYYKKFLYWHLVEKRNFSKAAGIVALTETESSLAQQFVPIVPVKVIPNGVNLEDFYPVPDRDVLKRAFPSLPDQPYLLFLSRLHPKKGLDVLFPAFCRLLEECRVGDGSMPYLVVAGEGEEQYRDELFSTAENLNLAERLLFTGLVTGEAKLALLHHCAFMVLPSRGEGLPMAILEALACRKPVILTPECYLPEVARSGAALEVRLDLERWVEAMAKLWHSSDRRFHMGENALRLIQEKFTWRKVAEETVQLSQELLGYKNK